MDNSLYPLWRIKSITEDILSNEKVGKLTENKTFHLEDSMKMYGIYNVETIEKVVQYRRCAMKLHEVKIIFSYFYTFVQLVFLGQVDIQYGINTILYIIILKVKYIKLYEELIHRLEVYVSAVGILSERHLTNSSFTHYQIASKIK